MSVKAKIEAVIYAAEEPVTLAQLTAVFASEILADLQQNAEPDAEPEAETAAENSADTPETDAATPALALEAVAEATPDAAAEASADQATLPITGATDADATRMARQRDRQVRTAIEQVVHELIADYASDERGMEIREIAGGYRVGTKAQYHDAVRAFIKRLKPPMKLSLQALETLAVVAYKQPVTAPEISEIRGVDSGGVLGSLISRKLIATAGRKQVIGRPILYKTTKEFLLRFGLKDLNDLPSIEEFEKMAAEMADAEAVDSSLHETTETEMSSLAEDAADTDLETAEETQP